MKYVSICFLLLLFFSGCRSVLDLEKEEPKLLPEIIQLSYEVKQTMEGMGADGPWIFFYYHFKNAEWLQLSLDGQMIHEGKVAEPEVSSGFAFQLFSEVNEMHFTVTIENKFGKTSQTVIYKK
jgi:hypothetical protein